MWTNQNNQNFQAVLWRRHNHNSTYQHDSRVQRKFAVESSWKMNLWSKKVRRMWESRMKLELLVSIDNILGWQLVKKCGTHTHTQTVPSTPFFLPSYKYLLVFLIYYSHINDLSDWIKLNRCHAFRVHSEFL